MNLNRRRFLASTVSASMIGVAGCSTDDPVNTDESSQNSGVLATAVSDQPGDIKDFKKMIITVNEIWVHPASDGEESGTQEGTQEESENGSESGTEADNEEKDSSTESGSDTTTDEATTTPTPTENGESSPIKIKLDDGVNFDLVKLQGDSHAFISEKQLPVDEYEQIKLWVGDEVDAVLHSGESVDVMTPGNAPLKFNKNFEIRADTRTEFIADFAPHKRGPNGYILKPVATETKVSYESLNSSSGDSSDGSSSTETETSTSGDSSSESDS